MSGRTQQIKPEFDFSYRKDICLNSCNGNFLKPKTAHLVYEEMFKAGFVSQLSSINAMEEFADSFSYFVMSKYLGATFEVQANGKLFAVDKILMSPQFQSKKKFLETAIKSLKVIK